MPRMYSGERILPRKIFNVTYQQSLAAYELAARYAAGQSVLDVACGEGYGTSLLGKTAKRVVGLDYNHLAVQEAQKNYGSNVVSFVQSNLFSASDKLSGELFDVVTCFQTIEHVQDHHAFLRALIAAVRPGGVIIVSTPNKRMFPSFNPYHVHELDHDELRTLFKRHFSDFTVLGVFGDETVIKYRTSKQKITDAILRLDFLNARQWLPGPLLKAIYALVSFFMIKQISLWRHYGDVVRLTTANFHVDTNNLGQALDFIVVAKKI